MVIRGIKVKDLMEKNVKTIEKERNILNAAKMMRDHNVSSLIIKPDDSGDAVGIITRKDILEALPDDLADDVFRTVEHVMTKPAITINSNLSIYNCQQLMRMVGVRRMPVVEGTDVVGILSNSDIFMKLVEDIN